MSAARMTQRYLGRVRLFMRLFIGVGLLVLAARFLLPAWFWHPLGDCTGTPHQQMLCKGYNSWSGVLGSWLVNTPQWVIAGMLLWFHHNCHTHGCWGWARKGKVKCKACERDEHR